MLHEDEAIEQINVNFGSKARTEISAHINVVCLRSHWIRTNYNKLKAHNSTIPQFDLRDLCRRDPIAKKRGNPNLGS